MATVDSGTETLFSDDSPCELISSPSAGYGEDIGRQYGGSSSEVNGIAPPNIQPYSGVLEKVSSIYATSSWWNCVNWLTQFV